jgi:hypothetical protein
MELYRADTDPPYTGAGSYWTDSIEDAEAYREAGPEGERDPEEYKIWMVEADVYGRDLDLRDNDWELRELVKKVSWAHQKERYLEEAYYAPMFIEERTGRRWPYSAWEEWRYRNELLTMIKEEGYEWIIYEDDYPEGAITYMPLKDFDFDHVEVEIED